MSGSNEDGYWHTEPGHYRDVYLVQQMTPYGPQPANRPTGWYRQWVPPQQVWVGPTPKAFKIGWYIVGLALVLFVSAMYLSLYTFFGVLDYGIDVFIWGVALILLIVGIVKILGSRPYDE